MNNSFGVFRTFSLAAALAFLCAGAFAVPRKIQRGQEAWRSLKKAQNALERNDFGAAVQFAEQGKNIRKQDAQWQTYVLENTLKKAKIRHAGDSLERVVPVIEELELFEAAEIVRFYLEKFGAVFFNGSYSRLMRFVSEYAQYPEADYILGKVYQLEGEYSIALQYMKNAYDYSANLDVPMEKYDLLYDLAQLSLDLGDEENYEKFLLVIVSDDPRYKEAGYVSSLLRTVSADTPSSVEKFFLLYRCENDVVLRAFIELGMFYMNAGETEKALKCMSFASVIAVTKIESVLKQRLNGFEYDSFESLLASCGRYSDIAEWGSKNRVWELFFDFSQAAAKAGKNVFARELLEILARSEPEEYWRQCAARALEQYKSS